MATCTNCKKRPAKPDRKLCEECVSYRRQHSQDVARQLRAQGLCMWCREPLDRDGRYCSGCCAALRAYYQKSKAG